MGANAQTAVPTFTAGQVLTAAQMNESARTGVPVFADTTARDAAFGGTGEKTLAEGQLAYVENLTGVAQIQYYDGASWTSLSAGGLVVVKSETAFTSATSVTADNVFTSTYTNYLIVVRSTTTANAEQFWALRVGGVTAATNYNYQRLEASNTTIAGARSTSQTKCAYGQAGTVMSSSAFILSGPNLAEATTAITLVGNQGASGGITIQSYAGIHTTATAYDGIELTGGTATGSYTIYGLAKS
jgi:hypothetical protein